MIRNYLLTAWRNLARKKAFSFINITGLAVGMAAAILIMIWVNDELDFDRFFANEKRIYQAYNQYDHDGKINSWPTTPQPMAPALVADYPEVQYATRVSFVPPVLFSYSDKRISARGNIVDSVFFDVFNFPLVKGNASTALDELYSMVITESLAVKLFGNENPVGKVIKVDNQDQFTVAGVVKDLPENTRFAFEFLISWSYMRVKEYESFSWSNNSLDTYVMLKPNANLNTINAKLKTLRKKYDTNDPRIETFLYPFSRGHLYGRFENGKEAGGRIEVVMLLSIIAGFILLIACINFMNLSTARSEKRAREVGIRKVVGAGKTSLILQFLGESLLITLISGMIALMIVQLVMPAFNELVGKKLAPDYSDIKFWIAATTFVLFTGLLAGSYPALYLSAFKPVKVLKGVIRAGNALVTPRKILVITQFSFAIFLIIATIVVRQQIKKAQDRQSNYNHDQLVYHFMEGEVEKKYDIIKQELLSAGVVTSMSKTSAPITEGWSNTWGIEWEGKDPQNKTVIDRFAADNHIVKTAGFELVSGRDFDLEKYPTDSLAAILNESAVKLMGFTDPIGKTVGDMGKQWHVIGVVKDFILKSPYHNIEPVFIPGAKAYFNVIHFKLNGKNPVAENIAAMQKIFKKYNPEYEFNYRFVDEEYARKFGDEQKFSKLASVFSFLAILISCLGLFGLASYMAENRIKEVGVRKVLGASVFNITKLLSVDFLKLIVISFVIAAPLAYWAMMKWLEQFPYRTELTVGVFIAAGVAAVVIAIATISYQAIKAALANPVESLRSE